MFSSFRYDLTISKTTLAYTFIIHKTILSFKNKQNTHALTTEKYKRYINILLFIIKIFFLFSTLTTLSKYRQANVRSRIPEGANIKRAKIK